MGAGFAYGMCLAPCGHDTYGVTVRVWRSQQHLECANLYVLSVIAGRANGARTLVSRMVGHRRGLEISERGSALPAFLRDKSRAPGEFSVGALNRYANLLALLLAARANPQRVGLRSLKRTATSRRTPNAGATAKQPRLCRRQVSATR